MSNLTITVDEQTLKRARMHALEEDTSVDAVLSAYLETYADARERAQAGRRILELTDRSSMSRRGAGLPRRTDLNK